jgi:hypothetical protein
MPHASTESVAVRARRWWVSTVFCETARIERARPAVNEDRQDMSSCGRFARVIERRAQDGPDRVATIQGRTEANEPRGEPDEADEPEKRADGLALESGVPLGTDNGASEERR